MNKILRSLGSREYMSDFINLKVEELKPKYETFVEPYFNTGSIFYNLENFEDKEFLLYSSDYSIRSIHQGIKESTYAEYKQKLDFILKYFGDILNNKEAYYNFRNWYNLIFQFSDGLFLLILANSCLSSALRFGPNGMNQSFGHRELIISEETFNNCKERLKNTDIFNMESQLKENSVMFIDLPKSILKSKESLKDLLTNVVFLPEKSLVFYFIPDSVSLVLDSWESQEVYGKNNVFKGILYYKLT